MTRQRAWCCRSCGAGRLVAGGRCRACYDRQRLSQTAFGGYRERVLARDAGCQVCLAEGRGLRADRLVVHHRRPGENRPEWQMALCRRCHPRIHHRRQLPSWYSALFLRLWRELHPGQPHQLCLPLDR